ncbi:MAG: hypothetical protein RIG82_11330 [Phycisphaeraceae bacterium]
MFDSHWPKTLSLLVIAGLVTALLGLTPVAWSDEPEVEASVEAASQTEVEQDPVETLRRQLERTEQDAQTNAALDVLLRMDDPPASLMNTLIRLRLEGSGDVVPKARLVLSRMDSEEVATALLAVAIDRAVPMERRLASIDALSHRWYREVIEGLLTLASGDDSPAIRLVALRSLQRLLEPLLGSEASLEKLSDWYATAKGWDASGWHETSERVAVSRSSRQAAELTTLNNRLRASARRVYRLTPADQQEPLLLEYLEDPLALLRQLGIDLVLQRLEQREQVGDSVRAALRQLLLNGTAELRGRAVAVLLSLNDDKAADLVADRLAKQREADAEVRSAMLKMLARKPRAVATLAMIELLDHPANRTVSAEALLVYAEAGMLVDEQKTLLSERLLALLLRNIPINAPLVRLYAQVADDSELDRYVAWLNHADPAVRLSAVAAWKDRVAWPMDPLVGLIDDELLGSIARERLSVHPDAGRLSEELLAGATQEITTESARGELLLALASRWTLDETERLDEHLDTLSVDRAMRCDLLEAALSGTAGEDPVRSLMQRRRLAGLLLAEGLAERALASLEPLLAEGLQLDPSEDVHDAAILGLMAAARAERVDRAAQYAAMALWTYESGGAEAGVRDGVMRVVEQVVQEALASNRRELAERLFVSLRPLLGEPQDAGELERLSKLAAAVAIADRPAGEIDATEAQAPDEGKAEVKADEPVESASGSEVPSG